VAAAIGAMVLATGMVVMSGSEAATKKPAPAAATHIDPADPFAMLKSNCAKCHNSEDWAGGVAFETMSPAEIAADAEIWEKAVRKLRGRLMPPPGHPQPDQQQIDAFVSWMETQLDQAAAGREAPGSVGIHRLNRTEYAREIKQILGLDIEVGSLLPRDVSSDGFDNIAASLRTSPAFLDQYITAARLISRQAIGRVSGKPSSREYRASGANQFEHIDGLPLGTRGGMLITHFFPADGEYEFNIRDFFFGGAGYITKVDDAHKVVMTIDDVPVFGQSFGGPEDLKDVDNRQAAAADEMQNRFNHIRLRLNAGPHRVGVAFVQRSFAESDSPLQPIAQLPEMERYPTIPGFDVSGPFNATGVGITASREKIFICRPTTAEEELPCARRILAQLASESFRRPATDDDLQAPMAFYAAGRKAGDFDAGIESGLTAILSSTKFLFRAEPVPANIPAGGVYALNDYALASRLSFFLWSTGPDQELITVATQGHLHEPAVLNAQVHRMLTDARSSSLITNFAFQWLNVDKIDNIEPSPALYPEFDRDLRDGFKVEMRLFLDSILRSNRSVLELLSSDQTFLNERLALHYKVPNIRGAQFRPVRLANPNRWGLLGKGALLMTTSYGNRTAPVLRGAYILENITGTPPSAPPPGVEALKETEPGAKAETVRQRLERHRENPSCNACHGVMDPLGFALENYDVVGGWRERDVDAGTAIDSSGQLADGTLIDGPAKLRVALLSRPDQFVQTLTEKLSVFALGRALRYQDMPTIRQIVRSANRQNDTLESIIDGIVASAAFQSREITPPAAHSTQQASLASPAAPR
jgi:mono/diheme cytochrome c family protein